MLSVCLFLLFALQVQSDLKIGAFNIQSFGKTKYRRVSTRNYLIDIVRQYDVVIIQEIKDKSQTTMPKFLADLQQYRNYSMALSPRLGRSHYREQYAIIYDTALVNVTKHTVYNDTADVFHREPIVAELDLLNSPSPLSLTVLGVHTDPDDVVVELNEMPKAYTWALSQGYPSNVIMMGDFNADCNYFRVSKYGKVPLYSDPSFTWMVPSDWDTTVSTKTDCAYDRFVVGGGLTAADFKDTHVDRFDLTYNLEYAVAKKVSDHYPISTTYIY